MIIYLTGIMGGIDPGCMVSYVPAVSLKNKHFFNQVLVK